MKEFGICRIAIVPMRDQPSDRSEMISQLLFGEHYQVQSVAEDGKWIQVISDFDHYKGWIDIKQHHAISQDYYQEINSSVYQITTDVNSQATLNGNTLHLPMGSILPISSTELFNTSGLLDFHGNAKSLSDKMDSAQLRDTAFKYLNAPYIWGGRSPWGIDCSGLVQQVFRIAGYALPRDSGQQINQGVPVLGINETRAGDLAFFGTLSGKVNHVGIILGDGQIIHASGKVRVDQLKDEGIWNGQEITHTMKTIRRVLK